MQSMLPPTHPNIDTLLQNPADHKLPAWHPRLDDMAQHRNVWTAGVLLCMMVVAWFVVLIASRWPVDHTLSNKYHTLSNKMAQHLDSRYVLYVFRHWIPAPLVPGVPTKTRLESSIKTFKHRLIYDYFMIIFQA